MNGVKNRQFAQALLPCFYEWIDTSAAPLAEYLQVDFLFIALALTARL